AADVGGEVVKGAGTAVLEDLTLDFPPLKKEYTSNHPKARKTGELIGHLITTVAGVLEMGGAVLGGGAGVTLSGTGVLSPVGVAVTAKSVALAGHGAGVTYQGLSNTGETLNELYQMFKSGGSNSPTPKKPSPQKPSKPNGKPPEGKGTGEGAPPNPPRKLTLAEKIKYRRPSKFRKGVRDKVWDNAKDSDGKVRDPLTKKVMNKEEPWDMGHKPGYEFRKHQISAAERGISRKQFLDEHNNPDHYVPELPSSNRSHKLEDDTDSYLGP
ncbi:HNH/ENDO VII family nuclease, partial [Paenibacillus dendritiformis]|uniref:HNH/ENDO VII family nuclease n=1 Tax=Paenibacillus dendritiformis TaxID=130049 RepID=UPI001F5560D5